MRPASILLLLAAALPAPAPAQRPAATGFCLVALEPNSPDDQVVGILHCGYSTDCCNYKLRTPQGMRIEIPENRFRGMVRLPDLAALHRHSPEAELARLDAVIEQFPLAAPSIAGQLARLRQLVENRRGHAKPPPAPARPPTRIAGRDYHDPRIQSRSRHTLILCHRDGITRLRNDSLGDDDRRKISKLPSVPHNRPSPRR